MLTEQEQYVVGKLHEHGFVAKLTSICSDFHDFQRQIEFQDFPFQEQLRITCETMAKARRALDVRYRLMLPYEIINPLKIEQEAWLLLSPRVTKYTQDFASFILEYIRPPANPQPLLTYINNGLIYTDQFNTISKSYAAKNQQIWNEVEKREQYVKKLIEKLQASS
jgi:hypothetical protein